MGDFIRNPRRFPRVGARCRVAVSHAGTGWAAETFDLSVSGCQIVTPRAMALGDEARLVIESQAVPQPLSVVGTVAWVGGEGRMRAGIAYADRQPDCDPVGWFKRLVASQPGLEGTMRRVPDRLPVDAKLFLRPPPRFIFDFGPDEAALLRMLGDGTTIATLLRQAPFPAGQLPRIVFSLLEKRVLTLSLGEAAPAWRWKAALADLEAQAAERRVPPPPRATAAPAPAPVRTPPPAPPPPPARPVTDAVRPATPREVPAAPPPAAPPRPAAPPIVRSPEAQECFDLAASAVEMGEISTAIGLLRRALQLAPRDPEISALLGSLAFRDRQPGSR